MATPIGADHITAIVNRHLMTDIIDLAYDGNPLFYRLHNSNRRFVDGGPHIEQPVMVSKFTAGGSFSDLDVLDMSPQDTLRTVAWDWKEKYVPVAFSNLTMVKLNTADSIANGIEVQVQQAAMTMRDKLGAGLFSTAGDPKEIDSLVDAISDTNTYAGVDRSVSGSDWWHGTHTDDPQGDLSLDNLNTWQTDVVTGGRFPTLAVTSSLIYNTLWNLLSGASGKQTFYTTNEKDTQMAAVGFNNFLFNGTPFLVDPNVGTVNARDELFLLNEDFIKLAVTPLSDFRMEPFQQAFNQAAIAAKLLWTGNLIVTAPKLQHRVTDIIS